MSMKKREKLNVSAGDQQEMDKPEPEEAILPSSSKAIDDVPPELLTIILDFVALGVHRNTVLGCRLVNPQWKDILDSLIEKKIVSGKFPAFPQMNIVSVERCQNVLGVSVPVMRFAEDGNPFPFNSLVLEGPNAPYSSSLPKLSLSAFASTYCGKLTSFSLCDQNISMKTLIVMLGSMPNLKRLRFQDVLEDSSIPDLVNAVRFLIPPPLSRLTALDVETVCRELIGHTTNILYMWLIASYANQLVGLDLQTYHPVPPLQASYQYIYVFSDVPYSIATTSESAFLSLKELNIIQPCREFLSLSETPALQKLSIKKTFYEEFSPVHFDLQDVIVFIDKCSSTLETLSLDISWYVSWSCRLVNKLMEKYLDDGQLQQLETGAVVPRLKTLSTRYPYTVLKEILICNFLVKFPALEELQLIHFKLHDFDSLIPVEPQNANKKAAQVGIENNQNADEIAALQERLPPLFQQLSRDFHKDDVASLAVRRLKRRLRRATANGLVEEIEAANAQIRQVKDEREELRRAVRAVQDERAAIFKRFAALGENVRRIMVRQLLERGGIWNICPSLRIVSVSYGEQPDGNVCVFRRGE